MPNQGEVCVSDEAVNSSEVDAVCIEILVMHTRNRIGVNALKSWRVADLKRRLAYLGAIASAEAIALVPRFEDQALGDNVSLGALDTSATYEARNDA